MAIARTHPKFVDSVAEVWVARTLYKCVGWHGIHLCGWASIRCFKPCFLV